MAENKQLEETLRKHLEQRGALLQALERIEGAIITLNNIIHPEQYRELLGAPKVTEAVETPKESKDKEVPVESK